MTRRVYDVVRRGGVWCVTRRGSARATARAATKRDAVARGRELGRAAWRERGETAQLVIHRRDGRIQTEHTYGADPFPPAG